LKVHQNNGVALAGLILSTHDASSQKLLYRVKYMYSDSYTPSIGWKSTQFYSKWHFIPEIGVSIKVASNAATVSILTKKAARCILLSHKIHLTEYRRIWDPVIAQRWGARKLMRSVTRVTHAGTACAGPVRSPRHLWVWRAHGNGRRDVEWKREGNIDDQWDLNTAWIFRVMKSRALLQSLVLRILASR